jgi:hypothetical protein
VTIAATREHLGLFDIRSFTTQTGETLGQVGMHDAEVQVLVGGNRIAQIPLSTVAVP